MQTITKTKLRRRGNGLLTASAFLLPSMIGLLIFSLMPLIISGLISLTDWNGLDQLMKPGFFVQHFIGFENYKTILTTPEFWRTLGNTAEYIVLYIPFMLAASLVVAYLLSRPHRAIGVFRVVYYIPVLTSWVAASLIWKSVLSPQYGALNGILSIFGIEGPGWLLDEKWAMPAIVIVSVWKDMGFFGLILLSGIVGINKTYYEAADIDGANGWTKFWRITLPLLTPSVFYVVTLSITTFMESWNDYLWPLLMLSDKNKMTLPIALSTLNGQYATEYNVLMAGSLISMIPIIVIYIIAQKQFKDGMMAGGIKG